MLDFLFLNHTKAVEKKMWTCKAYKVGYINSTVRDRRLLLFSGSDQPLFAD